MTELEQLEQKVLDTKAAYTGAYADAKAAKAAAAITKAAFLDAEAVHSAAYYAALAAATTRSALVAAYVKAMDEIKEYITEQDNE
jgi:hypothetical protein